mmetsp:Transcript_113490/g.321141  ORF Transcript_113490/g.321141 Transcript_113490/m.321141 type:complete len:212 (+) Transcript_113490:32-667(+)
MCHACCQAASRGTHMLPGSGVARHSHEFVPQAPRRQSFKRHRATRSVQRQCRRRASVRRRAPSPWRALRPWEQQDLWRAQLPWAQHASRPRRRRPAPLPPALWLEARGPSIAGRRAAGPRGMLRVAAWCLPLRRRPSSCPERKPLQLSTLPSRQPCPPPRPSAPLRVQPGSSKAFRSRHPRPSATPQPRSLARPLLVRRPSRFWPASKSLR